MAFLSDDPVTGIDFVPRGARVAFDDETNFEGVWSRFKIMQFGILCASTIFAILCWKIRSASFWTASGICTLEVVFARLT